MRATELVSYTSLSVSVLVSADVVALLLFSLGFSRSLVWSLAQPPPSTTSYLGAWKNCLKSMWWLQLDWNSNSMQFLSSDLKGCLCCSWGVQISSSTGTLLQKLVETARHFGAKNCFENSFSRRSVSEDNLARLNNSPTRFWREKFTRKAFPATTTELFLQSLAFYDSSSWCDVFVSADNICIFKCCELQHVITIASANKRNSLLKNSLTNGNAVLLINGGRTLNLSTRFQPLPYNLKLCFSWENRSWTCFLHQ